MYRRKFSNLSNAAVMLSVALLVGGCASQSQYQIQDILDARNVSDQGLELFVTGEFEKAVEAFDAVVAFGTIDDRVYTRRAAALGAMEKYDVALRDTERALALDPDNLRIHLQRAVFHQRTYKFDEAVSDLDNAIELNGNEIGLLRRRAYLKVLAGRFDAALSDYDVLSERQPNSDTGLLGRGVALYLSGEWEKAALAFTRILETSPADGLSALWLAKSTLRIPYPLGWEEISEGLGPEREWTMAKLLVMESDRLVVEDTMMVLYGTEDESEVPPLSGPV